MTNYGDKTRKSLGRVGSVEIVTKFDHQNSVAIEYVVKSVSKTKECGGKLA